MHNSSIIRLVLFTFALFANIKYLLFILNPSHMGNFWPYILTVIADSITVIILGYTWLSSLHYELFKHQYHEEIRRFKKAGKDLIHSKVAVLIPTVNESIEIIFNTIAKVLEMDGNKRVFILDDGNRKEILNLATTIGVNYLARLEKKFFKAGNLNHGLMFVDAEFIVVFDADFQPEKNFLTETLPLFIHSKIGAVQTPQVYYNEENLFSKGSKNFQAIFYEYIMPSKNMVKSAFCVGTNVVYRKSALDKINGIALVDHSEDVFTSLKLVEAGYRIFYLKKKLAQGLGPNNVISFFNQQFRWSKGGLNMLFKHNTLFNSKLTFDQRIQFFFSNFYYLSGLTVLIYLLNPLISIVFNVKPISDEYFWEWLTYYSLFFASNFGFYLALVKKNRIQSLVLGMFCFIPYTRALLSSLLNTKFNWKPTNFITSEIVTKIIAPLIFYVITSTTILYLFSIKFLSFQASVSLYLFWICLNTLMIFYLIFNAYKSVVFRR